MPSSSRGWCSWCVSPPVRYTASRSRKRRGPPVVSSRSTLTRRTSSSPLLSAWRATATSSSSGRARPGRRRSRHLRPALRRRRRRPAAEFQVNTYTRASSAYPPSPSTATATSSWSGTATARTARRYGIFARRFNAAGDRPGRRVPGQHLHRQRPAAIPSVALARDGDFVVAWESDGQDGDDNGVFARRFDAAGVASGHRVPGQHLHHGNQTLPVGRHATPTATSSSPGRATTRTAPATASSPGASTPPASPRRRVPGQHLHHGRPALPAVGMRRRRRLRRRLAEHGQDGSSYGVFARRFDAAGAALRQPSSRSTPTPPATSAALAVGLDERRRLRRRLGEHGQDGSDYGVFARRFDAAGIALAAEFQVNSYTTDDTVRPCRRHGRRRRLRRRLAERRPGRRRLRRLRAALTRLPAVLDIDGNGSVGAAHRRPAGAALSCSASPAPR